MEPDAAKEQNISENKPEDSLEEKGLAEGDSAVIRETTPCVNGNGIAGKTPLTLRPQPGEDCSNDNHVLAMYRNDIRN